MISNTPVPPVTMSRPSGVNSWFSASGTVATVCLSRQPDSNGNDKATTASRRAPRGFRVRGGTSAQPTRCHRLRVDALALQRFGYGRVAQQRRGQLGGGRGGLDAVAALACKPEQAIALAVPADHQLAIGREGPQPRPGVAWAADREGG